MDRLDITKDIASQRVYFYPQRHPDSAAHGRPSATPSVEILDQYGNTITADATTNVTQDTVNTTLSVAASAKDRSITLTSAVGIEARVTYLITNTIGQREWVRARSINTSSGVVELDEPLEYAYGVVSTASTFVGTRFYRTLQSGEVDTLAELYRGRATFTVSSINYVLDENFDVVLVPLQNRLTVEFVKKHRPDIMARQFSVTLGDDLQDLRESAWDNVCREIRRNEEGWRPALIRTPEDVEWWALAEFDLLCIENGLMALAKMEPREAIDKCEERIHVRKMKALGALSFMDLDEDDSRSADEEKPLTMSFTR